jgi:NADP-dependent 3-hydroxy acid dehydrogenase YdfG
MTKLAGKVALITGSGRGIGRAIALKLASEGASIVVNDLDAAPGDAVAAEIVAAGGKAIAVNGSVSDPGFPDRFVGAAVEKLGGLDIIVNNAGYTWDSTIQKMTDEQFQAMLDVHLVAPFRILRAAAEPIRIFAKKEAEAGREVFRKVVNISSIAGLYGNAGQASYSSAKASLVGLTRTMCKLVGPLQGQRQLCRLRPDQYPADPADRGAAEDHRCGGPRHQGGRATADARSDGQNDPAWPRRHPGRGRWRGLFVLQPGIELHQRPGSRLRRWPHRLMTRRRSRFNRAQLPESPGPIGTDC